jgi:hypothetical protein
MADTQLKKSLRGNVTSQDRYWTANIVDSLASTALNKGEVDRAARLFGAAYGLFRAMVNTLSPTERTRRENDIHAVRSALGEDLFAERWEQGRNMPREQAIAYALGSETDLKTT